MTYALPCESRLSCYMQAGYIALQEQQALLTIQRITRKCVHALCETL